MKNLILVMMFVLLLMGCQSGMYSIRYSTDGNENGITKYVSVENVESVEFYDEMPINVKWYGRAYGEGKDRITTSYKSYHRENYEAWNCLWLISCGIIPYLSKESMTYDVTVTTPLGKKSGECTIEARQWMGWLPILLPYPGIAEERVASPKLPNHELAGKVKKQLVARLVSEFSPEEYATFAKNKNEARKEEIDRIAQISKQVDDLIAEKKFAKAKELLKTSSGFRDGSLPKDKVAFDQMRKKVIDEEENHRVHNKQIELEKKFVESKFEDVVRGCEMESGGESRHASIWNNLKSKAEKAISERDRRIELARIEQRKVEILKLLKDKKYAEAIEECNKETGEHPGARTEDMDIWSAFRTKAKNAKDKIDRAAEEKRIAAKLEVVNGLLAEKKYSEVVALCEEERGQNLGSRTGDLVRWKSIRSKALANDLISKIGARPQDGSSIKGFYLGMSLEEVEILLDYYFPGISYSRKDGAVVIANEVMHFCETKFEKVTRLNFSRNLLEKLFDYDVQSDREWLEKFAAEYNLKFKPGYVKDRKEKGDASISVSQECYTHRNSRKNFIMKYFGEKDVFDYNKDPEEFEADAMREFARSNNSNPFSAYGVGLKYGIMAGNVKTVRKWVKENYINGKGGEEGSLRIEILERNNICSVSLSRSCESLSSSAQIRDASDSSSFVAGVEAGAAAANDKSSTFSSAFSEGAAAGTSSSIGETPAFSAGAEAGAAAANLW